MESPLIFSGSGDTLAGSGDLSVCLKRAQQKSGNDVNCEVDTKGFKISHSTHGKIRCVLRPIETEEMAQDTVSF